MWGPSLKVEGVRIKLGNDNSTLTKLLGGLKNFFFLTELISNHLNSWFWEASNLILKRLFASLVDDRPSRLESQGEIIILSLFSCALAFLLEILTCIYRKVHIQLNDFTKCYQNSIPEALLCPLPFTVLLQCPSHKSYYRQIFRLFLVFVVTNSAAMNITVPFSENLYAFCGVYIYLVVSAGS